MNDTVVTLAHELAHSLGSKHDEDVRLFTLKKRLIDFPVPSRKLFPARESLVNDIPACQGKINTLFLQCMRFSVRRLRFIPSNKNS
jgi:hypothetical protein